VGVSLSTRSNKLFETKKGTSLSFQKFSFFEKPCKISRVHGFFLFGIRFAQYEEGSSRLFEDKAFRQSESGKPRRVAELRDIVKERVCGPNESWAFLLLSPRRVYRNSLDRLGGEFGGLKNF
jgi:hypothetical protein